ncbi:BLUF domain-containing protein [Sphingosinicellaceae bacterium]|nr:BLUF domain-containing protein [Sphingosinicellaceae bacterium]
MALEFLIYASHPFGFDEAMLGGLLRQARRNNARDGITGALIVRQDLYLQWLEGPPEALATLYRNIVRDDRHLDVQRLDGGPATERRFADWAMRDDPARTWLWSRAEIADGALTRAGPAGVRAVFDRMAAEPELVG